MIRTSLVALAAVVALAPAGFALTPGGSPVSPTDQQRLGLVEHWYFPNAGQTYNRPYCGATLLSASVAITAGHCAGVGTAGEARMEIRVPWAGSVHAVVAYTKLGNYAGDPDGPDIAVLHLGTPVAAQPWSEGYANALLAGDALGATLIVNGLSTATWQQAPMLADQRVGRNLRLAPTPAGTTAEQGDSGSGSFLQRDGSLSLAAVTSAAGGQALAAEIRPHRDWIAAAIRAPIRHGARADAANIAPAEPMAMTNPPPSEAAIARLDWAAAHRLAQRLCFARGTAGGFWVPGRGESRLRLACLGFTGGVFRDATQAELDATGWGYGDPDATDWARAQRAATGLCAAFVPGSPGGVMTGFRAPPFDQPGQRHGVLCVRPETGRWRDLPVASLPFGARPLGQVSWHEAALAASSACRGDILASFGGVLTGHEGPGVRGVTCLADDRVRLLFTRPRLDD